LSSPTTKISDHERTNLQNTSNTDAASDSVTEAGATTGITTRWMGRSTVGKVIKPGVDLGVHNAGTEGGSET